MVTPRLASISDLPSLPSAGQRAESFLSWVVSRGRSYKFLWAGSIVMLREEGRFIFTWSKVSDGRAQTVPVEVHWALRVQSSDFPN
jgi:lysine/ornithine N-monooxygenase